MLSLFLTHLEGYKKDAIKSPILITLEVICELILPLVMAEIVDVAIPAGDVGYIFLMGGLMLLLSLFAMACGVGSAKYATCASVCSTRYRSFPSLTSTDFLPLLSLPG